MEWNQRQWEDTFFSLIDKESYPQLDCYFFESITSTNQILWELIDGGKTLPLVAIAAQQSAGRGQWGRSWQSPLGGLYLSLGLSLNLAATEGFHLTLLTAWGIAQALRCREIPVELKWPNDLILQGRKLGGIKTETRSRQQKIVQGVIGVGINWTNPVPEGGINLQSLPHTLTSLEELAAITVSGILSAYQFYQKAGIEPILSSYLDLLTHLGRSIVVQGSPGTIVGVNAKGELKIRLSAPGSVTEICLSPGAIRLGYDYI